MLGFALSECPWFCMADEVRGEDERGEHWYREAITGMASPRIYKVFELNECNHVQNYHHVHLCH